MSFRKWGVARDSSILQFGCDKGIRDPFNVGNAAGGDSAPHN